MAKKDFLIVSDESLNDEGYRVLTDGIDTNSRFEANPIMHYNHERYAQGKAKMPIGKWMELQKVAGGVMIAKPIFDETDPDGMAAKSKFDQGMLNTASLYGEIIELSEDPALMLPGQRYPTVTKMILDEISICDKPGNKNCVRLSYQGRTVQLSADSKQNEAALNSLFYNKTERSTMKNLIVKLNATGSKFGIAALVDTATEADVAGAIDKILAKAAEQETKISTLETEKQNLEVKLTATEAKAAEDRAVLLVDGAEAAGKIVASQKAHFVKLAKLDPESTKQILDGMPAHKSVIDQLDKSGKGGDESKAFLSLSKSDKVKKYDELHKNGGLVALKAEDADVWAALHEAKYGVKPKK
jgi:hypothetical protein